MRIDLHTHTINSDGLFTVEELVKRAVSQKIKLLSLTDHDTLIGVPKFLSLCKRHSISAIPGIELSTQYADLEFHILALNPHQNLATLKEHLEKQIKKRKERAYEVIQKLKKNGFTLSLSAEKKLLNLRNIGKPHIARAFLESINNKKILTREFHCDATINDFIIRILDKPGQIGYVHKERINVAEAIELIHKTGGKSVLAHPQFDLPKNHTRAQICNDLKSMGLDGLEAVNGRRQLEQRTEFASLAKKYGWFMTVGSDTHTTTKLGVTVSKQMYQSLMRIFF